MITIKPSYKNVLANAFTPTRCLALISTLIVIVWFATQHIGYNSDSYTYLVLSKYLIGNAAPNSVSSMLLFIRTPGYPLLMILGGVPFFNSFIGLLILQAIMAIIIPILIYRTLLLIKPRIAFLGAMLSIVSMYPYVYSKVIMTEQAFIFVCTLLIYLMTLYHKTSKPLYIYYVSACLIFLVLIRPSANFMFIIIFSFCLFTCRRNYKHVISSIVIFFIISAAWPSWVVLHSNSVIITESLAERIKMTIFYKIYSLNTKEINYISPANGQASQKLYSYLDQFSTDFKDVWEIQQQPPSLYSNYSGNPQAFIQAIYTNPTPSYVQIMNLAIILASNKNGEHANPNSIMSTVIWEAIKQRPYLLFYIIWKTTIGSATSFAGQQLFYQIYVASDAIRHEGSFFKPSNGAASQKLYEIVKNFVYDYPCFWEPLPQYAAYKGKPEKFLEERLLEKPDLNSFGFIWSIVDTMYTPNESPKFFLNAALEGFRKYPLSLMVIIENLNSFFFGPCVTYSPGKRLSLLTIAHSLQYDDPALDVPLREEIRSGLMLVDLDLPGNGKFWKSWGWIWLILKPVIFLSILLTCLLSIGSGYFGLLLSFIMILLYQGVTASIFAEPAPRYVDQIFLLAIMTSVISVSTAIHRLKNTRH